MVTTPQARGEFEYVGPSWKDRRKGKQGKVVLLVKEEINITVKEDISLDNVQSEWLELRNTKGKKTSDGTSKADKGESVNVAYLDFQKAFDKAPCKRLVRNIKVHSIGDDFKLGGSMCCEEDAKRLQGDLDRLAGWANTWQMPYNVDKCGIIHYGRKNRK
eukprot:g36654.t1